MKINEIGVTAYNFLSTGIKCVMDIYTDIHSKNLLSFICFKVGILIVSIRPFS